MIFRQSLLKDGLRGGSYTERFLELKDIPVVLPFEDQLKCRRKANDY